MLHAIIEGLIEGLIGPNIGKCLARFRYSLSFLIGFFSIPALLFFGSAFKVGWSKAVWGFSKMLTERKLGDLGFALLLSLIFGVVAVFMTALGRAAAEREKSMSKRAGSGATSQAQAAAKNED